jgi:hypothetical protein
VIRDQRTENRDQRTENREQRTKNREQREERKEQIEESKRERASREKTSLASGVNISAWIALLVCFKPIDNRLVDGAACVRRQAQPG